MKNVSFYRRRRKQHAASIYKINKENYHVISVNIDQTKMQIIYKIHKYTTVKLSRVFLFCHLARKSRTLLTVSVPTTHTMPDQTKTSRTRHGNLGPNLLLVFGPHMLCQIRQRHREPRHETPLSEEAHKFGCASSFPPERSPSMKTPTQGTRWQPSENCMSEEGKVRPKFSMYYINYMTSGGPNYAEAEISSLRRGRRWENQEMDNIGRWHPFLSPPLAECSTHWTIPSR